MATPANAVASRKLKLEDILDLRAYERIREESRKTSIETKRKRRIGLGEVVTIMFENRQTMWYQIQEMIRSEKSMHDEQVRKSSTRTTRSSLKPDSCRQRCSSNSQLKIKCANGCQSWWALKARCSSN